MSCGQGVEVVTTDSGMKFTVLEAGSEEITPGDMMLVHFVARDVNDSIWMDSRTDGIARPARKLDSLTVLTRGGLEEVLFYVKKGDSISCQVPVEKVYGNRALPVGIEKGSLLTVGIKVEDAMDKEAFQAYSLEMREKQKGIDAQKGEAQLTTDIELIDAYLAENNIEAEKTKSGLRYVITESGQGENVQSGQRIRANYAGHVLNGAFFDTSIEEVAKANNKYQEGRTYGPFETAIGVGQVIQGWDEAFQLMNPGSKATLYIPSGLGYGARARSAEITANAILVFDVELVEIIAE
jgi:FKBP-type peptidyl-prolyl cis-trans isomerase